MISPDIIFDMPANDVPLYVRLSADHAERLNHLAGVTGQSKRRLVEDAVRHHLGNEDDLVIGSAALREDALEVLTLQEAAAMLRVEDTALQAIAESGDVPCRAIGDEWRFSRTALLTWLGAHDGRPRPAA